MARLFTDGAEDPIDLSKWATAGSPTRVTTPVRSGVYAYRTTGDNNMYHLFTATDEIYCRVGWRINYLSDQYKTIQLRKGSTSIIQLGLDTTNRLFRLLAGSTVVGTGTHTFQLNRWYLLEIHAKIADSGGTAELMVDGLLDISYSGDTKPGADTTVDNLYISSNTASVFYLYTDDIAVNDVSGAEDNSWCGEGRVAYYPSDGAGDVTGLTPNTGANYAAVDERAQDGDTTYVEGGTVDVYDLYNVAASGLEAGATIRRVWATGNAKDTVANGGKIQLGVKTGGTVYWSDDIALTTDYTSVGGTVHTINPQTGTAWTVADIDGIQVGVKVRGT